MAETKSDKKGLFKDIFLIGVVILLSGLNILQFLQNKSLRADNDKVFKVKELELRETYVKMDSIANQLDNKIREIEGLGGDVDSLIIVKNQLEQEKRQLKSAKNAAESNLDAVRGKLAIYETILKEKDIEIVRLKEVNQTLLDETIGLKNDKNELKKELSNLKEKQGDLSEKVKAASSLKSKSIVFIAVSEKGTEKLDMEFRAKQISELKVRLKLDDNALAEIGSKKIIMRLNDPDKSTMYNTAAGSGTFTYHGSELFYTSVKEILYDNSQQTVDFVYQHGSLYKKGTHIVEFYCEGALIGKKEFVIK